MNKGCLNTSETGKSEKCKFSCVCGIVTISEDFSFSLVAESSAKLMAAESSDGHIFPSVLEKLWLSRSISFKVNEC